MGGTQFISYAGTFLVGAASGVLVSLASSSLNDLRRSRAQRRDDLKRFRTVRQQMPEWFDEIKTDLSAPGNRVLRDFYVLPSSGATFNGSGLIYAEDHVSNLRANTAVLQNNGYLTDVTHSNVPAFRMSEEFVALLFHK
jgi:hypothetical protein